MREKLYRLLMELTGNSVYNKILKKTVSHKFSTVLVKPFARTFSVDESELERDFNNYESLADFFTRELKKDSRTINSDPRAVVSPVDGVISQAGTITEDTVMTIKGKEHSLKTMLGLESAVARFKGGKYCVLYLSPKDYHRIHAPFPGSVKRRWALGKYSEPVNDLGFKYGRAVLESNYRLITEIDYRKSSYAVVKVGALNVNSIHPSHLNSEIAKGEEMAYFSFGSSVVLLFEAGTMSFHNRLTEGNIHVKQGEAIGTWDGGGS